MSKIGQAIIAINYFSLGLLIPVLNLVLLDRGANLETLPLLLAIYSGTVLLFELPSGICADLFGRRVIFLVSCVFQFLSIFLMFIPTNMVILVFVMVFSGLGRAFSSGSLDALIIEQGIAKKGEEALAKITSSLAVLSGIGLALGGIMGGFLGSIGNDYNVNIVSRMLLTILIFILCIVFVKEIKVNNRVKSNFFGGKNNTKELDTNELISEKKKVKGILTTFKSFKNEKSANHLPRRLWMVFAGIFFTGFFLSTIETYWQPAFKEMDSAGTNTWLLGIISFLGFAAVTAGNLLTGKVMGSLKNKWWKIFSVSRLLLGVVVLAFAMQNNNIGFIFGYFMVYLLMGINEIAENTIINKLIPNHLRSSILSFASFAVQIGYLSASIVSSILISRLHFSGLWILSGLLIAGYAVLVLSVLLRKSKTWEAENMGRQGGGEAEINTYDDTNKNLNNKKFNNMDTENIKIQSITPEIREEINLILQNQWFSTEMVIRGEVLDMTKMDGFAAYENDEVTGIITYRFFGLECEITSLDSFKENQGIGSELIKKVIETAKTKGCDKVKLITTNDNINALRFYQKRGFEMTNLYYNALEISRKLKPSIPQFGNYNIPIRHEIEFQIQL